MRLAQRELFSLARVHDPYDDWYEVYRAEITDKIRHWPANRKMDIEGDVQGMDNGRLIEGVAL